MTEKQDIVNLQQAIKHHQINEMLTIIKKEPKILNEITPFGSWLHIAATYGHLDIIELLINMGIDINKRGGVLGGSPINIASSKGYVEMARYLLTCGAEMDVSEPERNPLFAAIYGGHKEIVQLLLDNGIDYTVRYTGEHMTDMDAYEFAVERGQLEIAELIKNYK